MGLAKTSRGRRRRGGGRRRLTGRYDVEYAGALLSADAVASPAGESAEVPVGARHVVEEGDEGPRIRHGRHVAEAAVARPRVAHAVPRVRLDLAAQPQRLVQSGGDVLPLEAELTPRGVCGMEKTRMEMVVITYIYV